MEIYCCGCGRKKGARLTDGKEVYPRRKDLHMLPFWICDDCGNYVGCHHKTKDRTRPLGCIPTPEIRNARKQIHAILDPIWKTGKVNRKELYAAISREIGWEYHASHIKTMEAARKIYRIAKKYV